MPVNRIHIADFLKNSKGEAIVDVRSPAEYAQAHIPGAVSLPLFSNEERHVVGTAYKQESREQAIKLGLDFFGPKMRTMVEFVEHLTSASVPTPGTKRKVFVYCWRGGMRSGAVSWLLDLYGFEVFTLAGGYKSFRRWTLDSFSNPLKLQILGGYTGSGKTAVLQQLKANGEAVIDLEALACHKGSAFGRTDKPQPSQEMFENLLATSIADCTGPEVPFIWLEDESQRIGHVNIPNAFWKTMREAPVCFLDIPFEERLDFLVQEYGQIPANDLKEATVRISKRLGPNETKLTLASLEQGDIREAFRILLHYYDKVYAKGLHNRNNLAALLNKIQCTVVSHENARYLLNQHQSL